jgi:ribonuclease P protein component
MLPRALRLRKNRDFQAVYSRRRSWSVPFLALYVRSRGPQSGPPRFGVVISKKVAKRAHVRNQIKRRVTEICRTEIFPRLRPGSTADILFVARSSAPEATFAQLQADVERLMQMAGLI